MRSRLLALAVALASAPGCESKPLENKEDACGPAASSEADPPGWACFPELPCGCELRVAPRATCLGASPGWIERSDGAVELDGAVLLANSSGDSYQGRRLLSFGRDLGRIENEETIVEWTVLDVTSDEILFQARDPGGPASTCSLGIGALGQGNVVYRARQASSIGSDPAAWVLAGGAVTTGVPELIHAEMGESSPDTLVVGRGVIAAEIWDANQVVGIPIDGDSLAPLLIDETAALTLLGAWDETVFLRHYELVGGTQHWSVWAWDADAGLRPLVAPDDGIGEPDSACGLGNDGETMVWTEYSGWNGTDWDRIDLMQAPFTTQAAELIPTRVRSLGSGNRGCTPWRVGGGHAAGDLIPLVAGYQGDVVVRLSDGQAFTLPGPPPNAQYATKLYVTEDELAVTLSSSGEERIVRLPLALLGPGIPPSDPL